MKPGSLILMPAFGAGLTVCAHLVRWGDRVTPLGVSDADFPPAKKTALEQVNAIRERKLASAERSAEGMKHARLVETGMKG